MTNGYLLDTSIASGLWDELDRDHAMLRARLAALGDAPVFASVITVAEVQYGLRIAPRIDADRQQNVRENMAAFVALPIDHHVADSYAELRSRLFRRFSPRNGRGRLTAKWVAALTDDTDDRTLGIQENDLWQASLAMERNLILATNDRMTRIADVAGPDLRIEQWR